MTPKELGKWAKVNGINAPTIDTGMNCWINNASEEEKKRYYREWWEGWYEGLNESISFRGDFFTKRRSAA